MSQKNFIFGHLLFSGASWVAQIDFKKVWEM